MVGAGAAGLATAIFARRRGSTDDVAALDGARTLGAKILVSGGGRCNVTNAVVTAPDFHGGSRAAVGRVLEGFDLAATLAFFREIGVPLREEEGGKLFPESGRARGVLEALLREGRRMGVDIRPGCRVQRIERAGDGYLVHTAGGTLAARRVVLATGGRSLPKTGSDGGGYALARALGHTVTVETPALVPLVLEEGLQRGLSGVAVDVELTVRRPPGKPLRLRGPLLFTHFGVSGPVVLDASRHWCQAQALGEPCEIAASFLPGLDFTAADAWLVEAARRRPAQALRATLAERLPASLAAALVDRAGADPDARLGRLPRSTRRRLVAELLEWRLPVQRSRGYDFAEVTAGGVPLSEVDTRTMESRRARGLHLVGEILDVDGRIGGFNFQWAWSSAWAAAGGLARSL
ncbi:MAG TPA: aminoacetone oxidase family FAD-binding enzyme [Vicinamibacteria bacterium]|nr:aminoacetone oxidase family FAD-binding enzyme [Vicinamibacteria bacterium]